MGTDPDYIALSRYRHTGLDRTYIVSCVPDFLEEHPRSANVNGSVSTDRVPKL